VSPKLGSQGVIAHKNNISIYLTHQLSLHSPKKKDIAFEQNIFTNSILKYSALCSAETHVVRNCWHERVCKKVDVSHDRLCSHNTVPPLLSFTSNTSRAANFTDYASENHYGSTWFLLCEKTWHTSSYFVVFGRSLVQISSLQQRLKASAEFHFDSTFRIFSPHFN